MWKGREDLKDFELTYPGQNGDRLGVRHVPTGFFITRGSQPEYIEPIAHFIFSSAREQWSVRIVLWATFSSEIARMVKDQSFETTRDSERLRRRHGDYDWVDEIKEEPGSRPVPWDASLVDILIKMIFIEKNRSGFSKGKLPYPDHLDFHPNQLPTELHRKVINFVPEVEE